MASSILGKRTRSSTANTVSTPPPSHVKRQARGKILSSEDDNPFISTRGRGNTRNHGALDLDELSESISIDSTPFKTFTPRKASLLSATKKGGIPTTDFNDENEDPVQIPTPQTPRHRDASSKKLPVTPRHRLLSTGKPFTPRTPSTPGNPISTLYGQARQLFTRSTEPGRLVGRDAERQELSGFIQQCVDRQTGGCTYVSGPPGTGKSAMVNEVASGFETAAALKKAYINCMSMKTSKDVYGTLVEAFCEDLEVLEGEEIQTLQSIFVTRKKSGTVYLVTLDEIDHILTLDEEILYTVFEWSLQKSSRLILIGIANALDLTDRFLPRLKARNLKPQLLPFLPYDAAQIKTVIISRLKSLMPPVSDKPDYIPFLHPMAIELCSRKVSSHTGDLRKAFDICRRAIDLIESETKQKHAQTVQDQLLPTSPSKRALEENFNLSTPTKKPITSSLTTLTVSTAPRATISHVNKITSSTFGNGTNQRLKTLNLQQKAALCALLALEKRKREQTSFVPATPSKSKNAAPTIKALYSVYCTLCTRDAVLHPLTGTEFRDVVGSLETLSLVGEVGGRGGSFVSSGSGMTGKRGRKFGLGMGMGMGSGMGDEKRVGSCVGEKEVRIAVEGMGAGEGILKSILSGSGLD